MTTRRFPPPWLIAELEACFVVMDGAGQKLAYVYFEEEPGRRAARQAAHQGRGAKDCRRYHKAARLAEQAALS